MANRLLTPIPNLDPRTQTVLNNNITCTTLDVTNSSSVTVIKEGIVITPNFVPTALSGGIPVTTAFIIKLGNTNYALKFHLPQGSDSTMYITYAVSDSTYADGYQDFIGSLPQAYTDALTAWCSTVQSGVGKISSLSQTIMKKRLIFYFTGRQTTDINNSGLFNVDFKFQTNILPVTTTGTVTIQKETSGN